MKTHSFLPDLIRSFCSRDIPGQCKKQNKKRSSDKIKATLIFQYQWRHEFKHSYPERFFDNGHGSWSSISNVESDEETPTKVTCWPKLFPRAWNCDIIGTGDLDFFSDCLLFWILEKHENGAVLRRYLKNKMSVFGRIKRSVFLLLRTFILQY